MSASGHSERKRALLFNLVAVNFIAKAERSEAAGLFPTFMSLANNPDVIITKAERSEAAGR